MDKDKVSIIIPLYNSAKYITKCIHSCFTQTYENIEIIVVDDGSTDDGLTVMKRLAGQDKRLKVFHKDNGGVSSARNLGLQKATGEYICFVDADDILEPDFVKIMSRYMVKYGADFCFSTKTWSGDDAALGTTGKPTTSPAAEALLLGSKVSVGCWNKMYRKELINDIRFDEKLFYGEGLKFIVETAHKSKKTIVCRDGLYRYRKVNPQSATTKFDLKKMYNGEKSLLEIRKLIKNDGLTATGMWEQHYCLFCINAMLGIVRNKQFGTTEYKVWRSKFTKHAIKGFLSGETMRIKIKILSILLFPKYIVSLARRHHKGI